MVWELWKHSQAIRCRPSELCGIKGSIRQFYFDRGITRFGTGVENALDAAEASVRKRKGKTSDAMLTVARQQVLDKKLRVKPEEKSSRYKDPAANFSKPEQAGKPSGQKIKMSDDRDEIPMGIDFLK